MAGFSYKTTQLLLLYTLPSYYNLFYLAAIVLEKKNILKSLIGTLKLIFAHKSQNTVGSLDISLDIEIGGYEHHLRLIF